MRVADPRGRAGTRGAPVPLRARRRRWITVVGVTATAVAGLVTFVVASGRPQAPPPSTGCRDFYADIRIYTVGRLCWKHADATVTGTLTNPAEPMPATAQLCVSNHPDAVKP